MAVSNYNNVLLKLSRMGLDSLFKIWSNSVGISTIQTMILLQDAV